MHSNPYALHDMSYRDFLKHDLSPNSVQWCRQRAALMLHLEDVGLRTTIFWMWCVDTSMRQLQQSKHDIINYMDCLWSQYYKQPAYLSHINVCIKNNIQLDQVIIIK